MVVCRECGTDVDVHRGMCRHCRERARGADMGPVVERDQPMPKSPDLEPPHDRPWVARSAFTGRTRRSPRQ